MNAYLIGAMAALGSVAGYPDHSIPRMDWLAGYWLACDSGREVSETWSDMRGGVMLGTSLTLGRGGRLSWEQARIGPSSSGGGISFFAAPSGQPAAEFALARSAPNEAVFENPGHDFPQRLIYRRVGDRLAARIEGQTGGRTRTVEWTYRAAPLNSRCEPDGAGEPG
jgi:hypothetical protein